MILSVALEKYVYPSRIPLTAVCSSMFVGGERCLVDSLASATQKNSDLERDQADDGRVGFLLFKPKYFAKTPVQEK